MIKVEVKDPKKIKVIQQTLTALKRIGDDLKLEIDANQFVMRSLNSSKSALPVVRFFRTFFNNYEYNCNTNQVLCQLSISFLLPAFRNAQNASSLNFFIDPDQQKFTLELDDRTGISHSWELFMQDTVLLAALYDLDSAATVVRCRCDVFNEVKTSFKSNENIYIEAQRIQETQRAQLKISTLFSDTTLSSSLTIKRGISCEIEFRDGESIKLSVSLSDFLVAIKLSSIFNIKFEMYMISPGHPIIIKTSMSTMVAFEMALATAVDEWNEEQASQTSSRPEQSFPEGGTPSITQTERSQTSPWRGPQVSSASTQQTATPIMSSYDHQVMRDSQLMAMGLFEASPDYPYRRKITGQYAENSQPQSDQESDS